MTSPTRPIHPASVAIDSDMPGSFQPFTDLRSKPADGDGFATPLRTTEGGESAGTLALRAALGESLRMGHDEPGSHSHVIFGTVSEGRGEAANDHACAGTLAPACMTEAEFVSAMEAKRAEWNGLIDAMLDAAAPGWRSAATQEPATA